MKTVNREKMRTHTLTHVRGLSRSLALSLSLEEENLQSNKGQG